MPTAACIHDCPTHQRLCELDADHPGDHECVDCPNHLRRQRQQQIADKVTGHRIAELIDTTPDVD